MRLTTDFECGGGKRLTRLAADHWRVEANGDPSGYDKYFCLRVEADPGESALLRLEVHPDSELGEAGAAFFHSHFPSNIWYCTGGWGQWRPLRNTWEDSVTFTRDCIQLSVPIDPGTEMCLATNPPLRYSDMVAWAERLAARHPGRVEVGSIGRSAEGREIPLLRLRGASPRPARLFILAGQHPSEHCGNWACQGIVTYLLSGIAEAREVTDHFDVAVVPIINPDGNVHGLSGSNAEGVNLFPDFAGAGDGTPPRATENRLLWDWLCDEFPPHAILHFHGYMGWRTFAQHPGDGIYVLKHAQSLYPDPQRLTAYQAIQDRLLLDTPAYTATWQEGQLDEANLEHQLALRLGTLSAFYEINSASVGPIEQFRRGPQVLAALARAMVRDAAGVCAGGLWDLLG